ncbi:type II toxin-antitoxin system RelE/ParE family toxin [Marinoscillum pacificum]|uniref:type II toxin-antitoxin system RelE/ParE family toxin n=1 Tax=Marinoscillum pacificum TaxID=392723 RepID=UPI002157A4E9|nr:type II toxin-antitoxin system RelE/ParE family toxin [Marinoscillum pacificum]
MARKVIWSPLAQHKRKKILLYWIERNKSKDYSRKLNKLFIQAANLLAKHPNIGQLTDYPHVRVKIVRDYLLFYEYTESAIFILTIWDSRQNPEKLKLE